VLLNRFLALFAIWVVAFACWKNKDGEKEVHKLTTAIDQSPNPIMITDFSGKIEYVNPAFEERSLYTSEEVLGETPRVLKSGKHSPEFYKELWKTILAGDTWYGQIYNRRKNGQLYLEYSQISPLKDAFGKISHFFSLRLIDKHRELAEKEVNKLTHTLEQIPQMVLMTDLNGFIIYVNSAFEKVTGYSKSEILGMNPNVLQSGKENPEFYKQLWGTIKSGKSWRGEICNKRKNGVLFWEAVVISPVSDNEGTITHFIALRDDITHEKENEERFQKVQEQLAYSEKLASIGQLASGVSHNVLNPLNVISIQSQIMLKKHEEDSSLTEGFQIILNEVSRIEKIVRSLDAFSSHGSIEFKPTDLQVLFGEVLSMVEDELMQKNIYIRGNGTNEVPKVLAIDHEIRQVFINLIDNSRDAMPNGGEITVSFENKFMDMKPGVRILFSDTGGGIKNEFLDRVFNPFFTTKPVGIDTGIGKGTGMGLSICYGIIAKHGGKLVVESGSEKGATFVIDLPALKA